ncbi:MAG: putative F420-dependent oxidoreductase [Acidimicrobiaceae bacterium]|nr:putative F420-dependent oxidoreductase [Acidimicrobiaceae bacterium]
MTFDLPRRLQALRAHCEAVGRPYEEIEKSVLYPMDPCPKGENIDALLTRLAQLESHGVDAVFSPIVRARELSPLKLLGADVIPAFPAPPNGGPDRAR